MSDIKWYGTDYSEEAVGARWKSYLNDASKIGHDPDLGSRFDAHHSATGGPSASGGLDLHANTAGTGADSLPTDGWSDPSGHTADAWSPGAPAPGASDGYGPSGHF
jgi:hypothetical protein